VPKRYYRSLEELMGAVAEVRSMERLRETAQAAQGLLQSLQAERLRGGLGWT
jgi:hypothetical protein